MDVGVVSFILFVVAMAAILYFKRSQIEFQGIIAISRTKKLRSNIYNLGEKYKRFWGIYFNIGIIAGIVVMIIGTLYMLSVTIDVFSGISSPAFGLVIPYPTSEISYNSGFLMVPPWLWIIAIPILLIPHELSHGLALAANKLRIKSLGLLALLIIPGAFVEPDEKQLKKASKKQKLQVYCAGSFSNIVTGIIFILMTHLVLASFYAPAGIYYDLPYDKINGSNVIGNSTLENGITVLQTENATYLTTQKILDLQQNMTEIFVFEDLPAARNNISGTLKRIGNSEINSPEALRAALLKYKPGDTVEVETSNRTYNVTLADKNGTADLGVTPLEPTSLIKILAPQNVMPYEVKDKNLNPILNFILQVINFTIAVCIGVAIFNMLPLKPFDGGAVLETLTNSKIANISSILMGLLLLVNLGWAFLGAFF